MVTSDEMSSNNFPIRGRLADGSLTLCPLVLAADAAYAMPLATAIRSISESNNQLWPIEIHVIHDGIDGSTRQRIVDSSPVGSVSIEWHAIDLSCFSSDYNRLPYISKMTFARLLIPSILSNKSGKVLYLDSDILVVAGLARLCSIDLGNSAVAAVPDPLDASIKRNKRGLESVPRVSSYFNAGMLLVDLDNWRSRQITEKALHYLDRFPRSPFSDQDALNVACDGEWKQVGTEWNFQCEPQQSIASVADEMRPAIVHFVTKEKPWKPSSMSLNASSYDAIRSRTLFARTLSEVLREELARLGHRLLRRSSLLRAAWSLTKSVVYRRPNMIAQSRAEDL
jgi:lipopolysaccharide biosynthesis glycosyltransferase